MIANEMPQSKNSASDSGKTRPMQQLLLAGQAQPTRSEPAGLQPAAVLNSLRRSWKVALPIGAILAALGAPAGWKLMPPKHTASAYLRMDAANRPLIFETADQADGGAVGFKLYKNTQSQLMVTPFVLNAALRDQEIASLPEIRAERDPVAWLQEELRISFPADGEIMQVSIETESPTSCVKITNAVVDAYMNEVVINARNDRLQRLDSLERVYAEAEAKVRNKRTELKTLATALGTGDSVSLTVAQQSALQQFGLMQEKLSTVQFQLMQAEGELEVVKQIQDQRQASQEEGEEEASKPAPGSRTPDVIRLEDEVLAATIRLSAMKNTVGSRHPAAVALQQELAIQEQLLKKRVAEAELLATAEGMPVLGPADRSAQASGGITGYDLVSLMAKIDVLKNQETMMQAKVDELERETRQLGQSSIDIELMRSEIEGLEEVLRRVGGEIERTSIELKPASRIRVISPAETAAPPDNKKRAALAVALGLGGLLAPIALLGGWDLSRKRVDDLEGVGSALSVATLGAIPRVAGNALARNETRTPAGDRRLRRQMAELAESIDAVAAMVLHRADAETRQVFMISSAVAGEGKSTVACQLAESLARSGKRVALVDFDLRRPSLHRYFQIRRSPGIAEALDGVVSFSEAAQKTHLVNLDLFAAGCREVRLHERCSSGALHEFFDDLRSRYDLVVIDACPVLPVVDARIVGKYTDGAILTLLRDFSRLPAARKARDVLDAHGVDVLGSIVIGSGLSGYPAYYYPSERETEEPRTLPADGEISG